MKLSRSRVLEVRIKVTILALVAFLLYQHYQHKSVVVQPVNGQLSCEPVGHDFAGVVIKCSDGRLLHGR